MSEKISVVFFGTGPVAAKSLELLLNNFEVEAVITKPKPPRHRGNFPVTDIATQNNLNIYEVTDKKSLSELIINTKFNSKIGILIDFGIIVSKDVIDNFEKGIVNSHFSILPQWRGADPITFSILSGQKKTGVSLMLVDEGMDTGKLIAQSTIGIDPEATTSTLTGKLIELSDKLLGEYLPGYFSGEIKARNQPHPERATYSRKLTKDDGLLNFNKPAAELEREIRAFSDWPRSLAKLNDIDIIVTKSHLVDESGKPGQYEIRKHELVVYCGEKALSFDEVKPAGKPLMTISGFLAGYRNKL